MDAIIAAAMTGDANAGARRLEQNPPRAAANMPGPQPAHADYFCGQGVVSDRMRARGGTLPSALAAQLGMLDMVWAGPDGARPADDTHGVTLLHRACDWGQVAVAQYLLARGAGPGAPARDGLTTLDVVRSRHQAAAAELFCGAIPQETHPS